MIIGIHGKIGSGKDTVGKMSTLYLNGDNTSSNPFVIKKFADKLKDIVCLLIGCTREQLEDATFKNTQLSKEWTIYYYMGTYKGMVTKYSKRITPLFTNTADAFAYKDAWKNDSLSLSDSLMTTEVLTPRRLLELIGTDWGRNIVHPNIWVNATMTDYKGINVNVRPYLETNEICKGKTDFPNWIITDVRFPNEVQAIKDRDGIVIKLTRDINNGKNICEPETALDDYTDWDYIIDNSIDDSLGALHHMVLDILIEENFKS